MRRVLASGVAALALMLAAPSSADAPNGPALLRVLGPRAASVIAPGASASSRLGALVKLPAGVSPASARAMGLEPLAPGFARLRGSAADLLAFAGRHADLPLEVAPPVHTLLDRSGVWTGAFRARALDGVDGTGVLVGVADTGLDVSHPDVRDPVTGKTRVAWMLDLSLAPLGLYPDLEKKYGIKDSAGNVIAGAVLQGSDIDGILGQGAAGKPPIDEVGHGTHVTSIAAGNGGKGPYVGVAPNATILFARITRDSSGSIQNDDLVDGVTFLFDRADAMKKPVAVNLSLGSDFGPHDGTMAWEQLLASFVGPQQPGHALVIAAGNSGSISETPVHQSAFVSRGARVSIPITTVGASNGSVQVWVTMRHGATLSVGLDGPDGEWIAPVAAGDQKAKNTSGYTSGVINGSTVPQSPVPQGSQGAVVVWSGKWPSGQYAITLEGEGTAELYVQATGDAVGDTGQAVGFLYGVREGTVNLPATEPSLIAVGCTVNRPTWTTIDRARVGLHVPLLDGPGGLPDPAGNTRPLVDGEICWFSSAGPTVTGVPKPEIAAPGGIVIAAMSSQALPGQPASIFTNPSCPPATKNGTTPDPKCLEVDPRHAVAVGTSMSAPQVAGAVALLFQRDRTLTQDQIVSVLQAGAHSLRSGAPIFEDQTGPGELDVVGSLDALNEMQDPAMRLPGACTLASCKNWLTLSADYAAADGSFPIVAIVELRTADGVHRADMFDASRLAPVALLGGVPISPSPAMIRKGPGLWSFSVLAPVGSGGQVLTLGATFDGSDITARRTVPVAADIWGSEYSPSAGGSCAARPSRPAPRSRGAWLAGALLVAGVARRRQRATRPRR